MTKVIATDNGTEVHIRYECPGCKRQHSVPANRWNWNKSLDKPTISPSVRHFIPVCQHNKVEKTICHYFIREGMIIFCDDCEHSLKGTTHELPDITELE